MKHLIAALAKKKPLAIVDDEDKADVVVEVIDRGLTVPRVAFGSSTMTGGGTPGPAPPPTRVVHLRVTASAGTRRRSDRDHEQEPAGRVRTGMESGGRRHRQAG
jgi:hypothetical protein